MKPDAASPQAHKGKKWGDSDQSGEAGDTQWTLGENWQTDSAIRVGL